MELNSKIGVSGGIHSKMVPASDSIILKSKLGESNAIQVITKLVLAAGSIVKLV